VNAVQLTIDSTEPLQQVLAVVGALYGVEVTVASDAAVTGNVGADTDARSAEGPGAVAADNTTPRRAPRTRKGTSSAPTRGRGRRGDSAVAAGPSAVRAWAREHGHQVSDRGRIPAVVVSAFEAASV